MSNKKIFNFVLFFSTLIFSSCSILYSLSVSYFLTLLYGNTVTIYSLTVGSYMMFLGLGALMFERLNKKFGMDMLLITETALILIAFFAPLLISYIASMEIEYTLKLYLGFGILSLIGVFSGMELPLLMKLGGKNMSKIIGIDYLGGLAGSLLYVFFFLPHINSVRTFHIVAFINLVTTVFFYLYYKKAYLRKKANIVLTVSMIATGIILFSFSNKVIKISERYFLEKRLQLKVYL